MKRASTSSRGRHNVKRGKSFASYSREPLMSDTYEKLITLLDAHKAYYRLIDHAPEGQTDKVSALRGHPVAAAAKCIVLIVKIGKKTSRFVLAVVPVGQPVRENSLQETYLA